jgi:hypothetical protein
MSHDRDPAAEAQHIIRRRWFWRSCWIFLLAFIIVLATRGLWEINLPLAP